MRVTGLVVVSTGALLDVAGRTEVRDLALRSMVGGMAASQQRFAMKVFPHSVGPCHFWPSRLANTPYSLPS